MAARPTRPESAEYIAAVNQLTQIITETKPFLLDLGSIRAQTAIDRMKNEMREFQNHFQVGLFVTIESDADVTALWGGSIPYAEIWHFPGPRSACQAIPEHIEKFMQALPQVSVNSLLEECKVPECCICLEKFAEQSCPHSSANNGRGNQPNCMVLPAETIEPQNTDIPVRLPCGHIVGKQCIRLWLSKSVGRNLPRCPICRSILEGLGKAITIVDRVFYEEVITVPPLPSYSGTVGEGVWNGVWSGVWRGDLFR